MVFSYLFKAIECYSLLLGQLVAATATVRGIAMMVTELGIAVRGKMVRVLKLSLTLRLRCLTLGD